jgi:hypothetical protein
VEHFENGTTCAVNQKPREVTVFYFCDYFNPPSEFKLLELSEPDWCKYHVKVATKYMCGRGNMAFKYDVTQGQSRVKCMPRVLDSK